jgi:predicted secreted protein
MIRAALVLSATFFLACNGCNHDGDPPPPNPNPNGGMPVPPGPPGAETVVHAEDDGRTFDVQHGSMVTFKLAGNAGTGFLWAPAAVDPNILAQQGDRTSEVGSDTPGAPKVDVYHFLAGNPGTAVVEMDFKRPWGNQPPVRAIHVTVTVH